MILETIIVYIKIVVVILFLKISYINKKLFPERGKYILIYNIFLISEAMNDIINIKLMKIKRKINSFYNKILSAQAAIKI